MLGEMKIDAEKAKRQGVNLTVTGEQLAQYPELAQYLERFYGQTQQQQQPIQPQPGAEQQAQPTPQPQPAAAPV